MPSKKVTETEMVLIDHSGGMGSKGLHFDMVPNGTVIEREREREKERERDKKR